MIRNTPRIICIHGLLGSGKSTAAEHFERKFDFRRDKFAGTLKRMIAVLLEDAGVSSDRIARYIEGSQEDKAEPIQELRGTTCRHLMKMLGSEFRDTIYSELWMDTCLPRVGNLLGKSHNVVLDDFRFLHEHQATNREFGDDMVYVKLEAKDQEDIANRDPHQSERPLPDSLFHIVIRNNGSLEQLYQAMDLTMQVDPGSKFGNPFRIEAAKLDQGASSLAALAA